MYEELVLVVIVTYLSINISEACRQRHYVRVALLVGCALLLYYACPYCFSVCCWTRRLLSLECSATRRVMDVFDPFPCRCCGVKFTRVSAFTEHAKQHEQSLQCAWCGVRFQYKTSRDVHAGSHVNEKPGEWDKKATGLRCSQGHKHTGWLSSNYCTRGIGFPRR